MSLVATQHGHYRVGRTLLLLLSFLLASCCWLMCGWWLCVNAYNNRVERKKEEKNNNNNNDGCCIIMRRTTRENDTREPKETTAAFARHHHHHLWLMRFILISTNAGGDKLKKKKMAALAAALAVVCVLRSRMREIGDARFTIPSQQSRRPFFVFFFLRPFGRHHKSIKQQHPKMIYTAAHLTIVYSLHSTPKCWKSKEMYIFFSVVLCLECFFGCV